MSGFGVFRSALVTAVMAAGAIAAVPSPSASAVASYDSWSHRTDGATASSDVMETSGPSDGEFDLYTVNGIPSVGGTAGGHQFSGFFATPDGKPAEAGKTYRVTRGPDDANNPGSQFAVVRDGLMCGQSSDDLSTGYTGWVTAVGWFHVSELTRNSQGTITSFAATYEINCQYVGGPVGFEGSVAVNSTQAPVAVPAAPAIPNAVSNLTVDNDGPNGSGDSATTLTWTNPTGILDSVVDYVFYDDRSKFPALIGATYNGGLLFRGRGTRYHEEQIGFGATRTYRVIARGPTGRIGKPTMVTVLGNRVTIFDPPKRITMGQEAEFSGRLTEGWDYGEDYTAIMKGPPLAGRRVVLCQQPMHGYVDGKCTVVDRTVTAADGSFTMTATPDKNSWIEVMVPATSTMLGNREVALYTGVAPKTDLKATEESDELDVRAARSRTTTFGVPGPTARKSIRRGGIIHFTTSRARAGSKGIVRLQRFDGHRWHTIATKGIKGGTSRRVAIPYRETKPGLHTYRVVKLADRQHVNGYSRMVRVRVR